MQFLSSLLAHAIHRVSKCKHHITFLKRFGCPDGQHYTPVFAKSGSPAEFLVVSGDRTTLKIEH
ncbi:hypothetical protein HOLleu_10163 [Holothuria leucospilota]|uniref:Uncharacterized protein n=1 Tax=Holothuria leucospilota TaxID=206669 RepID=A0A9Q1HED2_HOLLE|nr:hypothetical protein HOLleu_10163 [Holothuria leucospilota]